MLTPKGSEAQYMFCHSAMHHDQVHRRVAARGHQPLHGTRESDGELKGVPDGTEAHIVQYNKT